jgi:crotonobetainyl-CoA:carnitine CoA-transferase CaiB-like acyl-CoA transferase
LFFPRRLQALSGFLDLTGVRSGPTPVRQLADWDAKVIKIDTSIEDGGGERSAGPRQNSGCQNLHLNQRATTLDLNDPKGFEVSCASRQRPMWSMIASDLFDDTQIRHLGQTR